MKKIISLCLVCMLIICLFSASAFAVVGGPMAGQESSGVGGVIFTDETPVPEQSTTIEGLDITKDPGSESKKAGEEVVFTAAATGYEDVSWYIISPNGKISLASEIPNLYKGATVTGTKSNRLVISNITAAMSGCSFYAVYSAGDLNLNTATASLTVEAVATPAPTPTTAPTPSPTPAASTGVVGAGNGGSAGTAGTSSGGSSSGSSTGSVSMMGTNTQNYNQDTSIGSDGSASEPTSGGMSSTKVENSRGTSHVGAYILAAVAGIVIIGAVLVMALYMRGKISLGKFEKFLGNIGNSQDDMFEDESGDESGDFYNPDDYK